MSVQRASLAEHVVPEVDEARLARQRAAIAARVKARGGGWKWLVFAAPAIVVALVALALTRPHAGTTNGAVPATVVEAPLGEPLPITLLDGSKVVLEAQTKLSLVTLLPKDIRLELARGSIDLDVTHVDGREFVVVAAGYEVRVLGTRFSVKLEQGALEVRVARGRVRVTRIGESSDIRVLGAGETWSTAPPPAPPVEEIEEIEEIDAAPAAPAPTASAAVVPAGPSGKELWARAESARAERRYQDEASALNELRLHHRKDPRAGLAAFELGRLRQDTLHEPARAAEAFADAIALAPNGPFREDAEARRVESLDAAGRRDACLEAKAAFLARYPGSIHRQRVSTSCEPR
jgi:transmembrane sensor